MHTEVMLLGPKGREEVNRNISLWDESVGLSLAEMTGGQPGFRGMTVEVWE